MLSIQKNFKKYPLEYSDEKPFLCEDKICQSIGENSHENSYEVLANLHICKKSHCGTLYLRDSQTSIMELYYFFFKHSFVDVWLGPKYPSEKTLKDKAGIFT